MLFVYTFFIFNFPQSFALDVCNNNLTHSTICSLGLDYDNTVPDLSQENPFKVNTSITLLGINELDEIRKTISINVVVSVWWKDTRITLKSDNSSKSWHSIRSDEKSIRDVFWPVLNVANVKTLERQRKLSPKDVDGFQFKNPHDLEYQQTWKVKLYCSFNFSEFPFDKHSCSFELGSAIENIDVLVLNPSWIRYKLEKSVLGDGGIHLEQDSIPFTIHITAMKPFEVFEAGFNFSYTGMMIHFKRTNLGLLLSGFYCPTLAFSIISLVSFSVHINSVPGRLGLLVTLFLIAANVYNSVEGPPDRGFSYLEIWMIGTQVPILIGIIEYGILLVLKKYWPDGITIGSKEIDIDFMALKADKWTMLFLAIYILAFFITYGNRSFLNMIEGHLM